MVKDILGQTFLIRQTLQENDYLWLPHRVHSFCSETPALSVHICRKENCIRTENQNFTKICLNSLQKDSSMISFTAYLVVISVTWTHLGSKSGMQAHPNQKQLNNSQLAAREQPEHYNSQSGFGINSTEQTFNSFCIQIKGWDLNGNEWTWEKARLLAVHMVTLTATQISDSDIFLMRWIAQSLCSSSHGC